jgi:hypothetical protein
MGAGADRAWFAAHPDRRFRARRGDGGWWLVRRFCGAAIRTHTDKFLSIADSDTEIAVAWYTTAYPELFAKALKKGRKATGGRR